jgi:hypothetical protein
MLLLYNKMNPDKRANCHRRLILDVMIPIYTILVFVSKIYGFFLKEWVHQGKDMKEWKGDLFAVYESGALIDQISYSSLQSKFCDSYIGYPNITSEINITYSDGAVLCRRFGSLNSGLVAFIVFSVITILISIFTLLSRLCIKNHRSYIHLIRLFNVLYILTETICMICLGAGTNFTLFDDCHYISWNQQYLVDTKTCPDFATVYCFFLSMGIMITNLAFSVLFCCYWKSYFDKYFASVILPQEHGVLSGVNSDNTGGVILELNREEFKPQENILMPKLELERQKSVENVD